MDIQPEDKRAGQWLTIFGFFYIFTLFANIYAHYSLIEFRKVDFSGSLDFSFIFLIISYSIISFGLIKKTNWLPSVMLVVVGISSYLKLASMSAIIFIDTHPLYDGLISRYVVLLLPQLLVNLYFLWFVFKHKNLFINKCP